VFSLLSVKVYDLIELYANLAGGNPSLAHGILNELGVSSEELLGLITTWIPKVEGHGLPSIGFGRSKWRYLWMSILTYFLYAYDSLDR